MTLRGFPDWQDYVNWRGEILQEGNVITAAGGITLLGPWPGQNFASTFVNIVASTNGVGVSVQFASTSTGTWRFEKNYELASGVNLKAIIPNMGDWVRIRLTAPSGSQSTAFVFTSFTNNGSPRSEYMNINNYYIPGTLSLGAGLIRDVKMSFIEPGPWYFSFRPSDATGSLTPRLDVLDRNGTLLGAFLLLAGPTAEVRDIIHFPDDSVNFRVTNTDGAAAHSYTAALIPMGV